MRRVLLVFLFAAACEHSSSGAAELRGAAEVVEPAAGFLPPPPDFGDDGTAWECDLYNQDCPAGWKCMPWANDGGGSWNATRCSPIAENAKDVGEPCTVEGSGVSGIDDCRLSAMCWNVDPETLAGTCFAQQRGDESNPICADPFTIAPVAGDAAITLCLPMCDPLMQDCLAGQACYAYYDDFGCAPDVSGRMGAAGDPCEFVNVCNPGTICVEASVWRGCREKSCCVPYCDTAAPDCPAGTACTPWYEPDDAAPPGFERVGICSAA